MVLRIIIVFMLCAIGLARANNFEEVSANLVDMKNEKGLSKKWQGVLNRFPHTPPLVGSKAPPIAAERLSGDFFESHSLIGTMPLVFISGSVSCPIYRRIPMRFFDSLRRKNEGKLEVITLYTLEAHPADENSPYSTGQWITNENFAARILVKQPKTYESRKHLAISLSDAFDLVPEGIVLDNISNTHWAEFGRLPNFLYIIDKTGIIRFKEPWAGQTPGTTPNTAAFIRYLREIVPDITIPKLN